MSNIPTENLTGMTRSELNSVIMNYLVTGMNYLVTDMSGQSVNQSSE